MTNEDKNEFMQAEIEQVAYLQTYVWQSMSYGVDGGPPDAMIEYFHHLYALMEKQSILYTRLVLMDDRDLDEIRNAIVEFCETLGKTEYETIIQFHFRIKEEIKTNLFGLTGNDPNDFEGIDVEFKWE